ncbi:hypothetical protein BGZ73_009164 [Actinomortierella ambigua]|nr:hypothetical protein BGZ73_009164 [Actinomortierella ambigua]
MSAEAARANSGAPNAQGNTDPVYELAPINYRMIYDYAFDIRECLVRGKPELLDKFLYSAEILCKVFNGCRVGCDFANAPQPAPAPQQLRFWGKMSRDRATKAKAKAEAAAKAAVAVSSSSSSTTIASVSSQMPDGRRSQPTSDADTPPIFASPIVADTDVAAKPTAVTVMSSSKLVQPSPSTAMPLKRERQLSFDSGNECDREDGGDSDVARSPFRTQSPQRSAQKRRLVVRPQERMSILRMPFHRSLLPVGDADEDEDNMPLPDLVRVTKKPTSSSSVPVIDVMTADSTQVKEAPPLIGSKTNTEAVPPPNEVKNKPVMINPGINRVPAVPNLSFISRSVYSHQVLLSDSVGDTPIAADVIGGKSDTLVERLVLQSQDSQENAVYSDRIN